MFYIVGLGNPGEKYSTTRHNIGWLVLDFLVKTWSLPQPVKSSVYAGDISEGVVKGEELFFLYPGTFMNKSGSAVAKLVSKNEINKLIVIHDDVDLPFGEIKISQGRGAGGNNGVHSIIETLGTKDFVRIRVGISPKSFWTGKMKRPAGGRELERFVLQNFSSSEQKKLPDICKQSEEIVLSMITDGLQKTMNRFN